MCSCMLYIFCTCVCLIEYVCASSISYSRPTRACRLVRACVCVRRLYMQVRVPSRAHAVPGGEHAMPLDTLAMHVHALPHTCTSRASACICLSVHVQSLPVHVLRLSAHMHVRACRGVYSIPDGAPIEGCVPLPRQLLSTPGAHTDGFYRSSPTLPMKQP